jgi:hypothetical protein
MYYLKGCVAVTLGVDDGICCCSRLVTCGEVLCVRKMDLKVQSRSRTMRNRFGLLIEFDGVEGVELVGWFAERC